MTSRFDFHMHSLSSWIWVGWSLFIPWLLSRRSPAVSCNSRFASPKAHFCSFPATKLTFEFRTFKESGCRIHHISWCFMMFQTFRKLTSNLPARPLIFIIASSKGRVLALSRHATAAGESALQGWHVDVRTGGGSCISESRKFAFPSLRIVFSWPCIRMKYGERSTEMKEKRSLDSEWSR